MLSQNEAFSSSSLTTSSSEINFPLDKDLLSEGESPNNCPDFNSSTTLSTRFNIVSLIASSCWFSTFILSSSFRSLWNSARFRTPSWTIPSGERAMSLTTCSWGALSTETPFTSIIWSPGFKPALWAGLPAIIQLNTHGPWLESVNPNPPGRRYNSTVRTGFSFDGL